MPAICAPSKVWDNAGGAGSKGSFWVGNTLNTLHAKEGVDAPKDTFWELKSDSFSLSTLPVWTPPKDETTEGQVVGTPSGHCWLKNQMQWCNNDTDGENAGVSQIYKEAGANGPVTNLVDGSLTTFWNADSCAKSQWVIFTFAKAMTLSAFKYARKNMPEAPKDCALHILTKKGWVPVMSFTGTKGDGWSPDYIFDKPILAQKIKWIVENTHAESTFFGGLNKTQGACVYQVQFHGLA